MNAYVIGRTIANSIQTLGDTIAEHLYDLAAAIDRLGRNIDQHISTAGTEHNRNDDDS